MYFISSHESRLLLLKCLASWKQYTRSPITTWGIDRECVGVVCHVLILSELPLQHIPNIIKPCPLTIFLWHTTCYSETVHIRSSNPPSLHPLTWFLGCSPRTSDQEYPGARLQRMTTITLKWQFLFYRIQPLTAMLNYTLILQRFHSNVQLLFWTLQVQKTFHFHNIAWSCGLNPATGTEDFFSDFSTCTEDHTCMWWHEVAGWVAA